MTIHSTKRVAIIKNIHHLNKIHLQRKKDLILIKRELFMFNLEEGKQILEIHQIRTLCLRLKYLPHPVDK